MKNKLATLLAFAVIIALLPVNAIALAPEYPEYIEDESAQLAEIRQLSADVSAFSNTEPLRPFPQRGQDSGLMAPMLLPPGATANPSSPEEADLQILRQFANLIDNPVGAFNTGGNWPRAWPMFDSGETLSLYLVDPATRGVENKHDFRMVMFIPGGTGGDATIPNISYRVTVCEAMGYGMLMLAKLAGSEDIVLGGAFGSRTMRDVLLAGLPVPLRYEFSADPNASNAVSFQTYFDAMFRSLRFWPTHPINQNTLGNHSWATGATQINNNVYRDGRGAQPVRSYQMAWSIHNVHGQSQGDGHVPVDNFFRREPGPSTATDGTMDMAYALILASEQWGDVPAWDPVCRYSRTPGYTYLEWATRMVGEIWEVTVHHSRHPGASAGAVVNPGYFMKIGNWAGSNSATGRLTRPSDHMMQHLRAFKAICQNPHSDWQRVIDVTYDSHRFVRQMTNVPGRDPGLLQNTGVLPDFMRFDHENSTPQPYGTGNMWIVPQQGGVNVGGERFHEGVWDGASHWNACRVPWRLGAGLMFSGTRPNEDITIRALHDFHVGLNQTWQAAVSGRWLCGIRASNGASGNNAFTGPMLIPAAIYGAQGRPSSARGQEWFAEGWNLANGARAVNPGSFNAYGDYINILTMIAASGNEWTPAGSPLTIILGTTTGGFNHVRRVVPGARVPLHTDDPDFDYWSIDGADFWPGYDGSTQDTFIRMPLNQPVVATAVVTSGAERFEVSTSATEGGTVTPGRHLAAGGTVTVTATVRTGFTFEGWEIDGIDGLSTTVNPLVFEMPANNVYITAIFEPLPFHQVNIFDGGFGLPRMYREGQTVSINAGTHSGYEFEFWTSEPAVDFANPFSPSTTFVMPGSDVTITSHWRELTPEEINIRNTAMSFVYLFTTPSGGSNWYGFNNAAPGVYVEFDVTEHQDVIFELPPWPEGSTGGLHSHRDIYVALPTSPSGEALNVVMHSVRINGYHVFGPMLNHGAPGDRWFMPGTMGTTNPVTVAAGGNANSTGVASAFANANLQLRTFYPSAGAFRIYPGDVVEIIFRVGDGPLPDIRDDINCPIFLAYVRSLDGVPATGRICPSYVKDVTVIAAPNRGITCLEGIRHFSNIRNIIVQGNYLTELDVSGLEYLEHLNASNNLLTSINVDGAISLAGLSISRNSLGEIIGLDSLVSLGVFWAEENEFSSLDFHANAPLQMVDVRGNTPSLSRGNITGVDLLSDWDQIATARPRPQARVRVVSGLAY